MKAYSIDLREKIVAAHIQEKISIRKATEMVDTVISVALNLMNPQDLKNWFTNCCYCTS